MGNKAFVYRSLILAFITGLFLNKSASQYLPTIEAGKTFTVELNYGLGASYYRTYTLICDTLIHSQSYLKLFEDDTTLIGYYREDTSLQEVYFLDRNLQEEIIVYTYNKEVGDTAILNGGKAVVQEVRYENIFGALRKILVINDLLVLIEGGGTSRYGIITSYSLPDPWPSLAELNHIDPTCEFFITSTYSFSKSQIRVYPNPFQNHIHVQRDYPVPSDYTLYDGKGNVCQFGSFVEMFTIDTDQLPAGPYFLSVNEETIKLVKQE